MGAKSKLTDKQWNAIGRRLLDGEAGRVLAREFGVSEAVIRKRFGAQTKEIKDVANQIVATERAFSNLPIGAQISARTLADDMKAISMHLAGAARFSAATAHRLSGIANARADLIPDMGELTTEAKSEMATVAALQKMANDAFEPGVKLINANKEMVAELRAREKEAQASQQEFKASNSAEAAVVYQQMIGSGS